MNRILSAVLASAMALSLVGSMLALATYYSAAQAPAEGAMGTLPLPPVVGMTGCPAGQVLATGVIDAAEHELTDGYFQVRQVTVVMPRGSVAWMTVRELRDGKKDVELVLRERCDGRLVR